MGPWLDSITGWLTVNPQWLAVAVFVIAPISGLRIGKAVQALVGVGVLVALGQVTHEPVARALGHPYVDVWQAVKPQRLGLEKGPAVPRTMEWKHGICAHLGWPHRTQTDIAQAWKRILGTVRSYADLEPALLGRVEELIDFVTTDPA